MDCPAKLYYRRNPEYVNKEIDDPFLDALAKGGFQVGELARQYHPTGILVSEIDHAAACFKTKELLKANNVIIFEAAFQYENFFIRTDIVCKVGNRIDLLEVKAKSYHPVTEKFYLETAPVFKAAGRNTSRTSLFSITC